jgi:hypothetical protein
MSGEQLPSESDLNTRLTKIEEQISQLSATVENIQEQLILVPDIETYQNLKNLLKEQNFKAADQETTKIMLDVAGEERDNLTPDDISKFPCNALRVIDRLWLKYSDQHFGFSLQLKTYYDVGGTIDTIRAQELKTLHSFGAKVGWLDEKQKPRFPQYDNWDFSLSAPKGCFPAHWWRSPYGLKMVTYFFSRLIACEL